MISFRFHIVSLSAVFMALALGIVLGTAFINDETIKRLETSIESVRTQRNDARADLEGWERFGRDSEEAVAEGQLEGVRILTIVPEGVSGETTARARALLARAGALDAGLLTVDNGWADSPPRTDEIAAALQIVGPSSIASVSDAAAARLASEFAAGGGPTLPALVDADLIRLDAGDPAATPGAAARYLVIDNGKATGLLEPLVRALATQVPKAVLVADASPDEEFGESLVAVLRRDREGAALSTIDHFGTPAGRVAAILALREFGRGATGDYGTDASADRGAPASG